MPRQLRMVRPNLLDLPDIELPTGYKLRTYRKSDELHWANIITDSFGGRARTVEDTENEITKRDVFVPDGLFFVTHNDLPVGTATAWRQSVDETDIGYVHMVGVLDQHTGRKLGKWVSLAVLYYFRDNGFVCSMLDTDDFRLPAIKTYLNLGFVPVFIDKTQPERWDKILTRMDLPGVKVQIDQIKVDLPTKIWDKISR